MEGRAIQIVKPTNDHKFELEEELLKQILLKEEIKDLPVVVISVAGAFRKGKSFLLDFFLRYLQRQGAEDWLGPDDVPLEGFSWRGGSERLTVGILLWPEVFVIEVAPDEKVAVLLMDTQGAFDSHSTVRECATVFALSTMLSSLQIFNLTNNIQEDDLQHLQLFTEYGRLVLEESGGAPFQKLLFLVRDWCFPYEAAYGFDGGRAILDRRLQVTDDQHNEHKSVRTHIRSCFSDIECCLLPHPGLIVATSPDFDGRLEDIDDEFKTELSQLVPRLLAPENLIIKAISQGKLKTKELIDYFKCYIDIYKKEELPEPTSLLMATAEANHLSAIASAKDLYEASMKIICGSKKPYIHSDLLKSEHDRICGKSVKLYRNRKKMGGEEFSSKYSQKLQNDLGGMFQRYRDQNEQKNIFIAARTPASLFGTAVLFYILSGFFGLIGLYTLANLANLVLAVSVISLVTWTYSRYTGDFGDVASQIDVIALVVWELILKPTYTAFLHKSAQLAIRTTFEGERDEDRTEE